MNEIKSRKELLDEVTLPENTVDMMNSYLKHFIEGGCTSCMVGLDLDRPQLSKLANMLRVKGYDVCVNDRALSIHI